MKQKVINMNLFSELDKINERPILFSAYTAENLWTDEHTSEQMLTFHLNCDVDVSSRKKEFIERSVSWIVSRFGIGPEKTVADFGCGPGLYANRLAETGALITGVDFSSRSINHARKTAEEKELPVSYIHANYLEFETHDRFDLITMIMCDFCALSPLQRTVMLEKFKRFLKPGGRVLLDVYSMSAFNARQEQSVYAKNQLDGFWSKNDYYGFLNTFKYEIEKVILDKYTIIEKNKVRTVYNWLQYFSAESIENEFSEIGLSVDGFMGDVAGGIFNPYSHEFAVIASYR